MKRNHHERERTCEDSIHGPYEPDDVADHCGGCGIPLCEETRKCPCCGASTARTAARYVRPAYLVCREHAKWNPEYAQYECPHATTVGIAER